jgi:DNA-binding NarL/FixJ family response regulator
MDDMKVCSDPDSPDELEAAVDVLVVDDRRPFRAAARAVVECTQGFAYAGEAETGEDGVEAALTLRPALVLMDVNLPGIDGCEATQRIREQLPDTVVFLVSTYASGDVPAAAKTCGAATYIRKERLEPALLERLWCEHRGRGLATAN